MKRIAFIISVLAISSTHARAQQGFFVFIQSEKQQPFYVRVNEKSYSSSAIGYLVIPSLGDSSYSVNIGFPRNQYPEQHFAVTMAGKDRGYLLKQAEGQGWSLFDEEAQQSLVPRQDAERAVMLGERKAGAFVTLMSSLVNDSAVMYRSIVKADLPKPAAPVVKTSSPDSVAMDLQAVVPDSVEKGLVLTSDSAKGAVAVKQEEARLAQVLAEDNKGTPDSVKSNTSTPLDPGKAGATSPVIAGAISPDTAGARNPVTATITNPVTTGNAEDSSAVAVRANENTATPDAIQKKDSGLSKKASATSIVQLEEQTSTTSKKWLYIDSAGSGKDTIDVLIAFETPPSIKDSLQVKPDTAITISGKPEQLVAAAKPDTAGKTHKDSAVAKGGHINEGAVVKNEVVTEAKLVEKAEPVATNEGNTGITQSTLPAGNAGANQPTLPPGGQPNVLFPKSDSALAKVEESKPASQTDTASTGKKTLVLMNSDCVNMATETDVDKLRIRILTANGVEDKINVVKKAFKLKCYATKDIRGLSELFANDESKFTFFDAAYPYVSDTGNFRQLLPLLTDDLYVARFKALVRM